MTSVNAIGSIANSQLKSGVHDPFHSPLDKKHPAGGKKSRSKTAKSKKTASEPTRPSPVVMGAAGYIPQHRAAQVETPVEAKVVNNKL